MYDVFVYGTLKKGNPLHWVLQGSLYLGEAETTKDYTLLDGAWYPFLIERKSENGAKGQIYRVTANILKELDRIEGHPINYERKIITVKMENGDEKEVYAYIHPDDFTVKDLGETYEW